MGSHSGSPLRLSPISVFNGTSLPKSIPGHNSHEAQGKPTVAGKLQVETVPNGSPFASTAFTFSSGARSQHVSPKPGSNTVSIAVLFTASMPRTPSPPSKEARTSREMYWIGDPLRLRNLSCGRSDPLSIPVVIRFSPGRSARLRDVAVALDSAGTE